MKKVVMLCAIVFLMSLAPVAASSVLSPAAITGKPAGFNTFYNTQRYDQNCWWGVNTGVLCGDEVAMSRQRSLFDTFRVQHGQRGNAISIVGNPGRNEPATLRGPATTGYFSIGSEARTEFAARERNKRWRPVDSNSWRTDAGY